MNKKYHVKRREFLSQSHDSGSYVIAIVEDAREEHVRDPDSDNYQEISLRIADGSHEIWLDFEFCTVEEREDSLHKIRMLAEVISEFKQAIEREIEVINARRSVPQHARAASAVH